MTIWPPHFPSPPPVTITATQSFSYVFRNVLFDAISALPYFANHKKKKTKMLPVQMAIPELPYLGVYLSPKEIMTPDGDANAGAISFIHNVRIGISVIDADSNAEALEAKLDAAFWAIMTGVWTDQYVMNRLDTWNPHTEMGNPDNVRVEGIERGEKTLSFMPSQNSEMPVGEMQYEIVAKYRSYFAPVITDDLLTIAVKTAFPPGSTAEEQAAVQQVLSIYTFEAN